MGIPRWTRQTSPWIRRHMEEVGRRWLQVQIRRAGSTPSANQTRWRLMSPWRRRRRERGSQRRRRGGRGGGERCRGLKDRGEGDGGIKEVEGS